LPPAAGERVAWASVASNIRTASARARPLTSRRFVSAPLIGLDWTFGVLIAVTAMFGDLLSSFIKRRMGLIPSSQCIGLDQIPESLLPLVACRFLLRLTILEIAAATVIFFLGELALSRVLFWLRIRERPY
jgi:hypothetical protein